MLTQETIAHLQFSQNAYNTAITDKSDVFTTGDFTFMCEGKFYFFDSMLRQITDVNGELFAELDFAEGDNFVVTLPNGAKAFQFNLSLLETVGDLLNYVVMRTYYII